MGAMFIKGLVVLATLTEAGKSINPNFEGACDLTNYYNPLSSYGYLIESQAAFDASLGNCSTIIGDLTISPNYTGPLTLNGLTNLNGSISTHGYFGGNGRTGELAVAKKPHLFLTSIQADDLVSMTELFLQHIPAVNSVSMPKLQSAAQLTVCSTPTMLLDFPELNNSTDVEIKGGYASLNFDMLVNVDGSIFIGSTFDEDDDDDDDRGSSGMNETSSPIDIKLPSLINATHVQLWGNISSLHMPNLATANKPAVTSPGDSTSGIFIHNRGLQPLDISLPQLSNASIIHVDGLIGNVSLSSLVVCFHGKPYNDSYFEATNFTFSEPGVSLYISGNVASIDISSFPSIGAPIYVFPDGPFDCSSLEADYAKIKGSTSGIHCSLPPKPPFHLSKGGEAGIGIAASVLGVVLLAWCISWKYSWRKPKKSEEGNRLPDYELATLDPVPKYAHEATPDEVREGGENGTSDRATQEHDR